MAIAINSIPILDKEAASTFIKKAQHASKSDIASIDFSKQAKAANKILKKAKLR